MPRVILSHPCVVILLCLAKAGRHVRELQDDLGVPFFGLFGWREKAEKCTESLDCGTCLTRFHDEKNVSHCFWDQRENRCKFEAYIQKSHMAKRQKAFDDWKQLQDRWKKRMGDDKFANQIDSVDGELSKALLPQTIEYDKLVDYAVIFVDDCKRIKMTSKLDRKQSKLKVKFRAAEDPGDEECCELDSNRHCRSSDCAHVAMRSSRLRVTQVDMLPCTEAPTCHELLKYTPWKRPLSKRLVDKFRREQQEQSSGFPDLPL
eukprot:TRINITY_DN109618_c0_g1_i1.p1 TRINITY_DN109618_c0_g1~~TRINITY_DN109618_c0_g1_i1.p1  ORF type:complete len:261 (+),score=41.29 TRINITY_DN109618_c0_g1_i1:56-838(+)